MKNDKFELPISMQEKPNCHTVHDLFGDFQFGICPLTSKIIVEDKFITTTTPYKKENELCQLTEVSPLPIDLAFSNKDEFCNDHFIEEKLNNFLHVKNIDEKQIDRDSCDILPLNYQFLDDLNILDQKNLYNSNLPQHTESILTPKLTSNSASEKCTMKEKKLTKEVIDVITTGGISYQKEAYFLYNNKF